MRGESAVVLFWGLLVSGLAAGLAVFTTEALQLGLFLAAITVTVLTGIALWAFPRRERPRRIRDLSLPTLALAAGVALLVFGVGFGRWLMFVGAGVVVVALGAIARETRAGREVR
jgi:hypothetical protein